MARNELSWIIRAINAVKAPVDEALGGFGKLAHGAGAVGRGIVNVFKAAVAAVVAIGGALTAAATAAVAAYAKQQAAENALAGAMRANGDNVTALMPKYIALANAIQTQTGAADESTLALMAQMRNLGVMPDQMEEATRGAIGLAKALNLDADASARYVALALQGEYTTLQRYVPALRTATTDAEKHAIVQQLMAQGFQQAQEALGTTTGRWTELKGRIGDAIEEVGRAIVENTGLEGVMASLSERVKGLGDRFREWAESGGVQRLILLAKLIGVEFTTNLSNIWTRASSVFESIGSLGSWLGDRLSTAFLNAANSIQTVFGNMRDNVSALFSALWQKITRPSEPFQMPDFSPLLAGFQAVEVGPQRISDAWNAATAEIEARNQQSAQTINGINEAFLAAEQARIEARKQAAADLATAEAQEAQRASAAVVAEAEVKLDAESERVKRVKELLKDVGNADFNITEGQARQFVRAMRLLADGLDGINFADLGLDALGRVDLGNVTSGKARQYVRAINELAQGLAGVRLPDLGAQLGLDLALSASIAEMARAIARADGAVITMDFGAEVTAAIKATADNTAKIVTQNTQLLTLR